MTRPICIDFDGVIHGYQSRWQGATNLPDPPVPGAIEWLQQLLTEDGIAPMIYSSRSKEPGGIDAMRAWLLLHGLTFAQLEQLHFPTQKPSAFLTIDDRAWCFTGKFPTAEQIRNFRTWQQ